MSTDGLTLDKFLGGRVTAAQPVIGFRAGHDTVLLAAAIPADSNSNVLELGAGAGIASLCLAARVPGARITGIEIDPDLVRLANENAILNAVTDRVSFLRGDAADLDTSFLQSTSPLRGEPAPDLIGGRSAVATRGASGGGPSVDNASLQQASFDHIFFNPPFHPDSAHQSPSAARDRATRDSHDAVSVWTASALALVREGGTVTAIVRADRVHDVQSAANPYGGIVFPLIPRTGVAPKRAIVRIAKTERGSSMSLPSPLEGKGGAKRRKGGEAQDNERFVTVAGLILHEPDGRNTEAAEAILRHGKALDIAP